METNEEYNEYNEFLLERLKEAISSEVSKKERDEVLDIFIVANAGRINSVVNNLRRYEKQSSVIDRGDIESEVQLRCIERFLEDAQRGISYDSYFFQNVLHDVSDTLAKKSGPASMSRSTILRRVRNDEDVLKKYSLDVDDECVEKISLENSCNIDDADARLDWEILREKAHLTDEEARVLLAFYGLEMKKNEIARRYGATPRHITYVLGKAMKKSQLATEMAEMVM